MCKPPSPLAASQHNHENSSAALKQTCSSSHQCAHLRAQTRSVCCNSQIMIHWKLEAHAQGWLALASTGQQQRGKQQPALEQMYGTSMLLYLQAQHMQLEIASLAPTQQCVPDAHAQGSSVPGSHRAAACRQRQRRHAAFCFTQSLVSSNPESTHICTGLAGAGGHKAAAAVASERHLQPVWSHTLMQTPPLGQCQAPDPHPWIAQASLALASTEPLLQRVPTFADDLPLLEAVAILLKPSYALAGGAWPDPDSRGV